MPLEETICIIWQGQEVGFLVNPVPDMWYLEGSWIIGNSKPAAAFEVLAKGLNVKEAYRDLSKGVEVLLIHENKHESKAVILALSEENRLYLRRVPTKKNVTEDIKIDKANWIRRMLKFIQ